MDVFTFLDEYQKQASSDAGRAVRKLVFHLASAKNDTEIYSIFQNRALGIVFTQLNIEQSFFNRLSALFGQSLTFVLANTIENLISDLNTFLTATTVPADVTATISSLSRTIKDSYESIDGTVALLVAVYSRDHDEKLKAVAIRFSGVNNVVSLTHKLTVLTDVYAALCELFSVSVEDNPLSISHIVSGSLFVKLYGAFQAMNLLPKLVEKAAQIGYRRYIKEGQIENEIENGERIAKLFELKKMLSTDGQDVSALSADLIAATEMHCANLLKLMYGEKSITVNEKEISLDSVRQEVLQKLEEDKFVEETQKLIPDNSPPKLIGYDGHKDESEEEEPKKKKKKDKKKDKKPKKTDDKETKKSKSKKIVTRLPRLKKKVIEIEDGGEES